MPRALRSMAAVGAALVLLVTAAPGASAGDGGGGGGRGSDRPDFEAGGGTWHPTPGQPGLEGDGSTTVCTAPNGVTGPITHEPPPLPQEHYTQNAEQYFGPGAVFAGTWYMRYCGGAPDQIVFVPGTGPSLALLEDIVDLTVEDPDIQMSPDESGRQLVGLESWLWIGQWQPATSEPSQRVPGLDIRITATPEKVTWDMGDGTPAFDCDAGTPYDPDRPADEQEPSCRHTFTRSSAHRPNGRFTVRATVHWTARVTVNGVLRPEVLTAEKTSSLLVRVGDRQALNRTPRRT